MTETELITKIITGTVTNEDCREISTDIHVLAGIIRGHRPILEAFGFKASAGGGMFGPKQYKEYMYDLTKHKETDEYHLIIHKQLI